MLLLNLVCGLEESGQSKGGPSSSPGEDGVGAGRREAGQPRRGLMLLQSLSIRTRFTKKQVDWKVSLLSKEINDFVIPRNSGGVKQHFKASQKANKL